MYNMEFDPKYLAQKQLERVLNEIYDPVTHTLSLTDPGEVKSTYSIQHILDDCQHNGNTYSWTGIYDRVFNEAPGTTGWVPYAGATTNVNLGTYNISANSLIGEPIGLDSYMEYTLTGTNITQVNYWTDSGKGTKLFTKDITYNVDNNPTTITMKDEINNITMTTTIAYSGTTITNITKTLT